MSGRRTALAAAALVASVALSGCSATADAGARVTPTTSAAADASPVESPPADLVASAALADCPATDLEVEARDDGLPDLTLPCLGDGPSVRLAGLRGAPTVLNLWASWCQPCRDELPLFGDLAGAGTPGLRVLGIAVKDTPASSLSLLVDTDIHYASVRDDAGSTQLPLRWTGLPMTVFVDADGVVTHTERGIITSGEQLRTLVLDHLGVTVPQ